LLAVLGCQGGKTRPKRRAFLMKSIKFLQLKHGGMKENEILDRRQRLNVLGDVKIE
jgi:hypothetical protein